MASARKPVRVPKACLLVAGIAGAGSFLLLRGFGPQQLPNRLAAITVDYPSEGSIFPPEITPPTFLWRDPSETATTWHIQIVFAAGGPDLQLQSRGELMRVGEIDDSYGGFGPERVAHGQPAGRSSQPGAGPGADVQTRC